MAKKFIQDLSKDFLNCPICSERFKKPVMLPCLHSFCFHCLKKYESNIRGNKFLCPVCRRSIELPEERVEGLPHNFFLSSLIDKLVLVEKLTTKGTSSKCNFCRENSSSFFCLECQFHICVTCKDVHSRIPGTEDHVIASSEKLSDENYLKKMMAEQTPRCKEHQGEKLRFFCNTCSQLICRDCATIFHQVHKCINAESEASLAKERLAELLKASIKEVEKGLKSSRKCDKSIKSLEEQASNMLREIDFEYAKCIKKLTFDKTSLCRSIGIIKKRKLKPQKEFKASYSNMLLAIKNTQNITSRLLEGGNPWEILRMEKNITRSFEELGKHPGTLFPNHDYSDPSKDDHDYVNNSSSSSRTTSSSSEDSESDSESNEGDNENDGSRRNDDSDNGDDKKTVEESSQDVKDDTSDEDADTGVKSEPSDNDDSDNGDDKKTVEESSKDVKDDTSDEDADIGVKFRPSNNSDSDNKNFLGKLLRS